jgi:chorismate mutase
MKINAKTGHDIQELKRLRKKVDEIDDEIISMLGKRQSMVKSIGKIKKCNGVKILIATRERQILKRILSKGKKNKMDLEFIHGVYRVIFKNSRKVQRLV